MLTVSWDTEWNTFVDSEVLEVILIHKVITLIKDFIKQLQYKIINLNAKVCNAKVCKQKFKKEDN